VLSITTALGAGISYPVSTAIADHLGMSAAFAVAGVFASLVAVTVMIRLPPAEDAPARPPDVVGILLLATGVTAYLLALTHGNGWGWASPRVLLLIVSGTLLIGVWVVWELRSAHPLVRLKLMTDRRLLTADVVAILMGISLYSTAPLVSRLAQLPTSTGFGLGLSLTVAGTIMIPIAFGNLLGSRISFWGSRFGGARLSLALGSALAMAGSLLLASGHVSVLVLLAAVSLTAVGAGATFGSMPALVIDAVPGEETGSAMSFNLLLRTVGGTIGSALTAAALGAFTPVGTDYPQWGGFRLAFLMCAVACLAALAVSLTLLPSTSRVRR